MGCGCVPPGVTAGLGPSPHDLCSSAPASSLGCGLHITEYQEHLAPPAFHFDSEVLRPVVALRTEALLQPAIRKTRSVPPQGP